MSDPRPPVPHDHVRIEGCYRCVWPDGQPPPSPPAAPSGEPDFEAIRQRVVGSHDPPRQWYPLSEREVLALLTQLADYKAGADEEARAGDEARAQLGQYIRLLAQAQRELEQVWQQRDQYLEELQQARRVVSAAQDVASLTKNGAPTRADYDRLIEIYWTQLDDALAAARAPVE